MKQTEVKYIGFYDYSNNESRRASNLPAKIKMDYISSALNRAGYKVNIISPSWMTKDSSKRYECQKVVDLNENTKITFCPTLRNKTKLGSFIKILVSLVWLCLYLLIKTNKDEKVIVYHVPWVSLPIRIAKNIKRFQLILEVEEIYGDVWEQSYLMKRWEQRLLNKSNKYILVSEVLRDKLEVNNKDSIILYGAYNQIPKKIENFRTNDYIRIVYAGSIDNLKGGAFKSVEILEFLPDNYRLDILGGGSEESLEILLEKISKINSTRKLNMCKYKGVLHGEEFISVMNQYDIALNPQNQGDYMNTAFPSKIITYLTHNLKVISTPIMSVKNSRISHRIFFSEDDSAKSFAKQILNLNVTQSSNNDNLIKLMDDNFVQEIEDLIEN